MEIDRDSKSVADFKFLVGQIYVDDENSNMYSRIVSCKPEWFYCGLSCCNCAWTHANGEVKTNPCDGCIYDGRAVSSKSANFAISGEK